MERISKKTLMNVYAGLFACQSCIFLSCIAYLAYIYKRSNNLRYEGMNLLLGQRVLFENWPALYFCNYYIFISAYNFF